MPGRQQAQEERIMSDEIMQNGNTNLIKDGKMNLAGMQIKISDIIGDKLVDQFIASISKEQMEEVTHEMFKEVFEEVERQEFDTSEQKYKSIKSFGFKKKEDSGSRWGSGTKDTAVYERAKETIRVTYTNMIEQKIMDYMKSEEFEKKAEKIAKEISDYALEGYKQDVQASVRRRLVRPVEFPEYPDCDIRSIVRQELMKMQG